MTGNTQGQGSWGRDARQQGRGTEGEREHRPRAGHGQALGTPGAGRGRPHLCAQGCLKETPEATHQSMLSPGSAWRTLFASEAEN